MSHLALRWEFHKQGFRKQARTPQARLLKTGKNSCTQALPRQRFNKPGVPKSRVLKTEIIPRTGIWPRGSTGVERYGCIPRSAGKKLGLKLGEIPQETGAPNPLFSKFFRGGNTLQLVLESPSLSGIRPHFPFPKGIPKTHPEIPLIGRSGAPLSQIPFRLPLIPSRLVKKRCSSNW